MLCCCFHLIFVCTLPDELLRSLVMTRQTFADAAVLEVRICFAYCCDGVPVSDKLPIKRVLFYSSFVVFRAGFRGHNLNHRSFGACHTQYQVKRRYPARHPHPRCRISDRRERTRRTGHDAPRFGALHLPGLSDFAAEPDARIMRLSFSFSCNSIKIIHFDCPKN